MRGLSTEIQLTIKKNIFQIANKSFNKYKRQSLSVHCDIQDLANSFASFFTSNTKTISQSFSQISAVGTYYPIILSTLRGYVCKPV